LAGTYPVYVVDDQEPIRVVLCDLCDFNGWKSRAFASGAELLDAIDGLAPGCILLDMRMPGIKGLEIQAELAARRAPFAVIAITGYGDVDMAVESMKMGAIDFIEKPFDNDVLVEAIGRAFARLDALG
jgi:two-component system, LuxR family, response regulator FixJ